MFSAVGQLLKLDLSAVRARSSEKPELAHEYRNAPRSESVQSEALIRYLSATSEVCTSIPTTFDLV